MITVVSFKKGMAAIDRVVNGAKSFTPQFCVADNAAGYYTSGKGKPDRLPNDQMAVANMAMLEAIEDYKPGAPANIIPHKETSFAGNGTVDPKTGKPYASGGVWLNPNKLVFLYKPELSEAVVPAPEVFGESAVNKYASLYSTKTVAEDAAAKKGPGWKAVPVTHNGWLWTVEKGKP